MSSFIERAEAALRGEPSDGVHVVRGERPVILDAAGRRALVAPLLAAFLWAAVAFRRTIQTAPLDPIGLLLLVLALGLSARALFLLAALYKRTQAASQHARHALVLCEDGLLLRTPVADYAVQKSDIVQIVEHGSWGERSGRRFADVYVITRPSSGRTHLAIPPFFAATPGMLAERLMRWRGPAEAAEPTSDLAREPAALPSKLFDAAAAGEPPEGTTVIRHGLGYLRRGPFATVLLGAAVLIDWLRIPAEVRSQTGPLGLLVAFFTLIVVPGLWLVLTRVDLAPRKGIALVLTPAEMLMRTRAGVHRVGWDEVSRLEITSRTAWSVLEGPKPQRALVIHRKEADTITYVEEFLGAPAEVVVGLCEGYRKGVLP